MRLALLETRCSFALAQRGLEPISQLFAFAAEHASPNSRFRFMFHFVECIVF
jgi:hypothetical protein